MPAKRFSNVIGFDDAPFAREGQEKVKLVGAVFADLRFDGVLIGEIGRDGTDAANRMAELVSESKFAEHIRLIMLQGITFGGFNVADVFELNRRLGIPILVVCRKLPDMNAVRNALIGLGSDWQKKWAIIEKLGEPEPTDNVYVQRVGIGSEQANAVIKHFAIHSHIPEPIRAAHLIAGAISDGQSRGNV